MAIGGKPIGLAHLIHKLKRLSGQCQLRDPMECSIGMVWYFLCPRLIRAPICSVLCRRFSNAVGEIIKKVLGIT
jgi:hypothetical protein